MNWVAELGADHVIDYTKQKYEDVLSAQLGLNVFLQGLCAVLGWKITRLSKKTGTNCTFVFVQPSGKQLAEIGGLVDSGKIKPVVDRVFSMEKAKDAFSYVALGRTKGKVVLKIKNSETNKS